MASQQYDTDILVVGSGAGGLTAAVVAADHHAKVLVVEKSELFGGTSATSGGVLWIPCSHYARALGKPDTPEEAFDYISALAGGDVNPDLIRAFISGAPEMLRYLEEKAGIRYKAIPYTDYHAELPGGKLGYRSHDPEPIDGRLLGKDLDLLRPPHVSAMLFGRITWTAEEAAPMISRRKGWMRALGWALWRYYSDVGQRLRSRRSRFLTMGNALMARLKLALDARRAPLWLNTALRELIVEDGRVVGAILVREGRDIRVRARRGVILAAGGFERNAELRGQYVGDRSPDPRWSGSQSNNIGDALVAALKLGAATARMDSAWWAPTVYVPGEDRARPLFFERGLPGSIIVNQAGERFTNEAASYHIVGQEMMRKNVKGAATSPSFVLFDSTFRARYPMGPVMPGFPAFALPAEVRGILIKAASWEEMADKLEIPHDRLTATIRRFNDYAAKGEDPDFQRGYNAYDNYYGDPRAGTNPNLAPLVKGPFYALPVNPGDIGTSGGLATDSAGAVIDHTGQRIPGLYAIGNTAASMMGGAYPGAGATLGPAMTFGYVAALDALGVNK